jgi:prevent-host-death family protein
MKARLSKLIESAIQGEEVIITCFGKPIARLVATRSVAQIRRAGALKGKIRIADDFEAIVSIWPT